MQKILVPTDFSANAFSAVAYAAEITKITGGTIYLLNVIEPSLNMATMQTDSRNKNVLKERREQLRLLLRSILSVYPVKIIPLISGGGVTQAIVETAKNKKVNMVIMGTTGAGNSKRFLAGSVASGVVANSPFPVLTVPVSFSVGKPQSVVFATNHFEKSKRILNKVFSIPALFCSTIHIVAFTKGKAERHGDLIYNNEQMEHYRNFLAENYPELKFVSRLVKGDDFETAVEAYCVKNDAGMIIMTSYPKSFLETLFRKSMTRKMAFYSNIPIMAVPVNKSTDSSSKQLIQ